MSILETLSKVRQAEEEAGRIIEEARAWKKNHISRAQSERVELIDASRRKAEQEGADLHRNIREETLRTAEEIRVRTEAEKEELTSRAARNRERAIAKAMELFLEAVTGGGR